jgi:hypothetical protein
MNWSLQDVLTLARLSSAAYDDDSKAATNAAAPGVEWVGQLGNAECQATIAKWGGFAVLVFRGTQISPTPSIPELWDDIDGTPLELFSGVHVHSHFWQPMAALWPDIEKLMPAGRALVTGHSLGGVRAQLSRANLRDAEVVTFGAPRGADDAFWWWAYEGAEPPLRVVHENDFAPDWKDPWAQPGPMLWLRGGKAFKAYGRSGVNTSILDLAAVEAHSIDGQYIPAIEALVAPQAAAA